MILDYAQKALKLSHEAVKDGVAATFERGVPAIPVKIGDRQLTVDLDTGNGAAPLFVSEAVAKTVPQSGRRSSEGRRAPASANSRSWRRPSPFR